MFKAMSCQMAQVAILILEHACDAACVARSFSCLSCWHQYSEWLVWMTNWVLMLHTVLLALLLTLGNYISHIAMSSLNKFQEYKLVCRHLVECSTPSPGGILPRIGAQQLGNCECRHTKTHTHTQTHTHTCKSQSLLKNKNRIQNFHEKWWHTSYTINGCRHLYVVSVAASEL